jgi:hypothetical protein
VTDLAITARCWEDLSALPAEVAEHVIQVFVERRGLDPESGETMRGVGGPLRKLHADLSGGRSIRAVTWYDRSRDVCWLLASGWHDDLYARVERLAETDAHLPTPTDIANFEADAPIRAMERVIRQARSALEYAMGAPGTEVPLTLSPSPEAYFRVEGDLLWLRIVLFAGKRRQVTPQQVAVIRVAVFGNADTEEEFPAGSRWDSLLIVGALPSLDSWPPPPRFLPSQREVG